MLADLLALLPLALLVLLTAIVCEWAARGGRLPYWVSRKILHVIAVGACAWAPLWVASTWSLVAVVAPACLVLLWLVTSRKLMVDGQGRRPWGIVWFPLAFLILLLACGGDKTTVVFSMAVLAICDPAATIAGTIWGKRTYNLTGEKKSWVGNAAFVGSFLLVGGLALLVFSRAAEPLSQNLLYLLPVLPLAGIILAAVEALGSYGRDNLYLPLVAAALWQRIDVLGPAFQPGLIYLVALCATLFLWYLYKRGSLTADGAVGAALLAVGIVWFGHWTLLFPVLLFFASSLLVGRLFPSHLPSDRKAGRGRDLIQVYANGGVYLLLLFLLFPGAPGSYLSQAAGGSLIHTAFFDFQVVKSSWLNEWWLWICTSAGRVPGHDNWVLAIMEGRPYSLAPYFSGMLFLPLAAIATATADTWSSEVGRYFQGRTYDILRFRRVEPGLSGGVSLSGTLAGGLGAGLIGALGFALITEPLFALLFCGIIGMAGFVGMLIDSVIGSGLQAKYRHPETDKLYDHPWWLPGTAADGIAKENKNNMGKLWMSNDLVNFLGQVIVVALLLFFLS